MTAKDAYKYGIQDPKSKNTKLLEELLKETGDGISFLPTDINSPNERLKALFAECNAGNRGTRNEIVAIVDNLVERKQMPKSEARG